MSNKKSYSKFLNLVQKNKFSLRKIIILILVQSLTVAIVTFFTSGYSFVSIPKYKLNDIAREDIIAPEDFEVTDMTLTAVRREKARKAVFPLYDYDPDVAVKTEKSIREAFKKVRELLAEKEKKKQNNIQGDKSESPAAGIDDNYVFT